ncbi:MAG: tRNA pseudouridine(55) synthase TruB [Leptospiraceae bacterium]|nr:tRNA pseudouridine(55) synthase TruB [Leptospiraceae bacterium]
MQSWTKSKKASDSIPALTTTDGLLLLDKPSGPGSAEMVGRARRATGIKRIGHTGTLDRFASGLLVLVVGRATVLADEILRFDKSYDALFRAGRFTDTHDPSGQTVDERTAEECAEFLSSDAERFAPWFAEQIGRQQQLPPHYSAIKHQGRRLSDRMRKGLEVELKPRTVEIFESSMDQPESDEHGFFIRCHFTVSSGTYIRSLVRDFSQSMGFPFYLESLRRTRVGPFSVEDAWVPPESRNLEFDAAVAGRILDVRQAFPDWPAYLLDVNRAAAIEQGKKIPVPLPEADGQNFFLLRPDESVVAIARRDGAGYGFRKVFAR